MKKWCIIVVCVPVFLVLALILIYLLLRISIPEGAVPTDDIVSHCVGDVTGDGISELLVISGSGEIDTGERHGQHLLVCEVSAWVDFTEFGYIPREKITHSIDLTGIKPLKVQIGDINGDGINEVALCVYKTAIFHEMMAKRPFFFDLVDGNLIPVWLGSRLSRPFDDYVLFDVNDDGFNEIVSIEQLENGGRVVAIYIWKGFGFEVLVESPEAEAGLRFDTETPWESGSMAKIGVITADNEHLTIAFSVSENEG